MKTTESIMTKNYLGVKMEVLIDNRYQLKDGTFKIVLRVYADRKYTYLPTGHYAKSVETVGGDVYDSLETMLNRFFRRYKDEIDNGIFSIRNLNKTADTKVFTTLNQCIENRIDRMIKNGQSGTVSHWKSMLKALNTSVGQLPLKSVNARTLKPFTIYLQNNYSQTTQVFYLNDLRAAINEAIYNKHIKQIQNPFKSSYYDNDPDKIIIPKSAKRTERYLTKDEITAIYLENKKKPDYYTCLFLLSYLFGGINIADIVNIKFDDHFFNCDCKEFAFIRQKTQQKQDFKVRLGINEKINEIMCAMGVEIVKGWNLIQTNSQSKKYNEVYNISQLISYHTQKTAKRVGIDKKITPTYARHSFATIANRLQLPYNWIEYTMGHSNNSISSHYMGGYTTEQLIEFTNQLL